MLKGAGTLIIETPRTVELQRPSDRSLPHIQNHIQPRLTSHLKPAAFEHDNYLPLLLLSSLANTQFMEISTHLVAFLQNHQHPLFTSSPFRLAKNSSIYEVTSSHFILWHFAWSLFTFPVFASFTKLVQFLHHNFADTREESALNSLSPRCHKFKTPPSSQLHDISTKRASGFVAVLITSTSPNSYMRVAPGRHLGRGYCVGSVCRDTRDLSSGAGFYFAASPHLRVALTEVFWAVTVSLDNSRDNWNGTEQFRGIT